MGAKWIKRARALWRQLVSDWPRWAQVAGVLLGSEQVLSWWLGGNEPNVGAMTFAGALLMFQRVVSGKDKDDHGASP